LNGQTSAHMLGMGRMISSAKDSIGAVLSRRDGLAGDPRVLVGLVPLDTAHPVVTGSHLFTDGAAQSLETDQGWITSACHSPHLGHAIGLGFLTQGAARIGEVIIAANPIQGQSTRLRVVDPCFIDKDGGRMRA
jgi:sarcosine oxidase subunit alpha